MITWWQLFFVSIAYVAALFAMAHWGDSAAAARRTKRLRPYIYCLTLGVYCTSWTFYGAVGTAARAGWGYLPIYLGPIIGIVFGFTLMRRIVNIADAHNLTSIADFIAARYGKGRALAVLVTVVAVIGTLPYIALQLKAVADGFQIVTASGSAQSAALLFAVLLAVFAMAFGTRRLDAAEHNRGMMLAIAFESLVKLLAFVLIGVAAIFWLRGSPAGASTATTDLFSLEQLPDAFITQTLLAAAAIFCLPRQFHVMAVEVEPGTPLASSRWLFPLYLLCFAVFVVPMTYAGLRLLPTGAYPADAFVLALPMHHGSELMTLLAFLGGFSAATGMVIIASVALATMVSNEIAMPLLFSSRRLKLDERGNYRQLLLKTRRLVICGIIAAAYAYYLAVHETTVLASIGLLSFSAAAQFAPLMVAGVTWPGANQRGAMAGLLTGFGLWAYTLLLPAVVGANGVLRQWIDHGPLGITALRPEALMIDLDLHPLTHGVLVSLAANTCVLLLVSYFSRRSVSERIAASEFASVRLQEPALPRPKGDLTVADLTELAQRFLGGEQAARSLDDFARGRGLNMNPSAVADRQLVQFIERLLAGAVGTSSARVIMTAALQRKGMGIGDVVLLLDETSQAIQFNRQLLEATLANMSQGVSVIDASQRVIGWNTSYLEMMGYDNDLLYVGMPIVELLEFNARRGHFAGKNAKAEISKRLERLRCGSEYRYESEFPDGRVIDIRGRPMPDGGYVTTFNDITEAKAIEAALRDSEKRVRGYTDNLPVMIAYIDTSTRLRFANKAYARYVGVERAQLIGRPLREIVGAERLATRQPRIDAALAGERQDFELEERGADDVQRTLLASYVPDVDEHERVFGLFATFQDISVRRDAERAVTEAKNSLERRVTERTRELSEALASLTAAQQAAEEAHASKTRFFAAAAHDLLQPINAAKLFSELLLDGRDALPDEQRKMVERVGTSLGAVEELLNALLEISQFDAGTHTPELETVPLQSLFDALEVQFAESCRERGLSLRFVATRAWTRSDPRMLRRILQNFIANAQRYTPSGGIVVGVRRRGAQHAVCVYDTGVGIAQTDQETVFEEFRRLNQEGTRKERGMGLGLAIVQRIARLLEHPVSMASRPGAGSCFEVLVPAVAPTARGAAPRNTATGTAVSTAPSADLILCIDNDEDILDGMVALLERWGTLPYTARGLRDIDAALDTIYRAHGRPPELLLVDYHLDDGDTGLAAIAQIEARCQRSIPVIFLTASREPAVTEALESRGHRLLHKPIKPAALRALMSRVETGQRKAAGQV